MPEHIRVFFMNFVTRALSTRRKPNIHNMTVSIFVFLVFKSMLNIWKDGEELDDFFFGNVSLHAPNFERHLFFLVLGHRAQLWLLFLQTEMGQSWEVPINATSYVMLEALSTIYGRGWWVRSHSLSVAVLCASTTSPVIQMFSTTLVVRTAPVLMSFPFLLGFFQALN